ncbi:hypothetical protein JHN59_41025 [Streptomyces sp. MBT49]|uniref:hypothetical protein n=1 Tax=Streptomyces sp. MBT49 TaxID=1488380 RepID=UPI00190E1E98|nr:hypothetical protein [Streptomyces sp. MBT49]MBK3631060.1 hypothetical protein [Streptomyces sp. MBT49]
MNGLRVVPAWRHGQERLYVCLKDGRNIAWYDREAARINLIGDDRREAVLEVLGPFITGPVTVGPQPLLRRVRADADRASHALIRRADQDQHGPDLGGQGVGGAADALVTVPAREVRVLRDGEIGGLARLGGVLKPADVEALHAMARDRGTWTRV